jgi:hypothetical protein
VVHTYPDTRLAPPQARPNNRIREAPSNTLSDWRGLMTRRTGDAKTRAAATCHTAQEPMNTYRAALHNPKQVLGLRTLMLGQEPTAHCIVQSIYRRLMVNLAVKLPFDRVRRCVSGPPDRSPTNAAMPATRSGKPNRHY